ncbi:TRADD-N-associated membrane domain-containing protein [Streptomyces sp. NBC_01174]|uniref:TRADD-N-associated membrane domain-containing protein n=1 Tax=Streptomyces sp. NBC_01174 TaxID=2903758 RepID=UPI002F90BFE4|nr:hypothetical protein OG414_39225 [Streptomyces sp. NBC_01174]
MAALFSLAGAVHQFAPQWEAEGSWQRFVVGIAGGAVVAAVTWSWRSRRSLVEAARIDESRQRLNVAEDRLGQALRFNAVQGVSIGDQRVLFSPWVSGSADGGPLEAELEDADDAPASRRDLALPELWATTHARLDLYHKIATKQAEDSFRNAQAATVAGFVLLLVFVVLALNASTSAGAIVAGGLGAVSAALSSYVSRTFIRSQEAAATHLRSYFDQPLELSRYLAAERLVADGGLTQEQRGEVLSALVQAMVAAPAPPVAGAPIPGQQGP